MAKITETNLGNVEPGPSADLLLERTKVSVQSWFGKVGLHRETRGSGVILGAGAVLSGSVVPAVGVGLMSLLAGAPPWMTPVLSTFVFVLYGVLALRLSDRYEKRVALARAAVEKRETAAPKSKAPVRAKKAKGGKKKR